MLEEIHSQSWVAALAIRNNHCAKLISSRKRERQLREVTYVRNHDSSYLEALLGTTLVPPEAD
jgi:hypothetical protein